MAGIEVLVTLSFNHRFVFSENSDQEIIKDSVIRVLQEEIKKIEDLHPGAMFSGYKWSFNQKAGV